MAPLADPVRLAAYKDALRNWRFDGYIQFELTEAAFQWVKQTLRNISLREIGRLMFEYVEAGGLIDEVRETREVWAEYMFHYDLRFKIREVPVYIESRLHPGQPFVPDESTILVVSIHAP